MELYQERVFVERNELAEKKERLASFLGTPIFRGLDRDERDLLQQQYVVMSDYLAVLDKRLARWKFF